jgi:hypothetical protein
MRQDHHRFIQANTIQTRLLRECLPKHRNTRTTPESEQKLEGQNQATQIKLGSSEEKNRLKGTENDKPK